MTTVVMFSDWDILKKSHYAIKVTNFYPNLTLSFLIMNKMTMRHKGNGKETQVNPTVESDE